GIVSTTVHEPPFALSYAMTYHVVQGATLDKAILDFNNYPTFPTGLNINSGYVAITRAKELKSIRVMGLNDQTKASTKKTIDKFIKFSHNPIYIQYIQSYNSEGYFIGCRVPHLDATEASLNTIPTAGDSRRQR
ncbi:hypothetical protein HDU76_011374, partial [Blyttiomyces sp. JEL0837]